MQVYIHVGYPKNASTMLQTDIFPNLPGIVYCGRRYGTERAFATAGLDEAIRSITFEDSLRYDAGKVRAQVAEALTELVPDGGKLLLSWEAFMHNVADRGLIAARLKELFPEAKIIFVIRNQLDSIESMYHFLVEQGGGNINPAYGRPSVRSLKAWLSDQEKFSYRSYLETLKYDELHALYAGLFSAENVKMLLFEELKKTPQVFLDELGEFLSVGHIPVGLMQKRNARSSAGMGQAFKLRNWLRSNGVNLAVPRFLSLPLKKVLSGIGGLSTPDALSSEEREELAARYRDGNSRLQVWTGKDLGSRGYPVVDGPNRAGQ
ncbi:MAG: sulfotransferase domain-containing protein [Pseudomonadota bacterium]